MLQMRILYQDQDIVVVDKPVGFQVHPPEDRPNPDAKKIVMKILRDQLQHYVYPVHRLDRATSGVLIFALNPESAANLQKQFQEKIIIKNYIALVRGWTEERGLIESPLSRRLDGGEIVEAKTEYETLFRFEKEVDFGKFSKARYSLIRVSPQTGRLHQIRRHLKRISHPLIGDTVHGDGKHNRAWRVTGQGSYLFLKAITLQIVHPRTQLSMEFRSKWNAHWHQLFDDIGFCAFLVPQAKIKQQ